MKFKIGDKVKLINQGGHSQSYFDDIQKYGATVVNFHSNEEIGIVLCDGVSYWASIKYRCIDFECKFEFFRNPDYELKCRNKLK